MSMMRIKWWRLPLRLCGGLTLAVTLPLLAEGAAQEALPPPKAPPADIAAPTIKMLSLAECLASAREKQPTLAAAHDSLAAAQAQLAGLEKLKAIPLVPGSRELPIRRKQACLGVAIAEAGVIQAEHEVFYAVQRTYWMAQYARAQQRVTHKVVANLKFDQETVKKAVESGESRDFTRDTVDKITVYLRLAESKEIEATQGVERATAALREAIGVGPQCCIKVAEEELRFDDKTLCLGDVIQLALERRAEMTAVNNLAEVYQLEIDAQGKTCINPTVRTFASATDIHARNVPQGSFDTEYRPGGLTPEMPVSLVGPRSYRIERASAFSARTGALVEKTRNLIALEAEDAYQRWQEARMKVLSTRDGKMAGDQLAESTRKAWLGNQKVKVDDLLTNEVLAAQAAGAYNEALFHYVNSLAVLERVTAGGFCAGLVGPIAHAR